MSKTIELIELKAGKLIPGGRNSETIVSRGHRCEYCHGNGYFWDEDDHRERYKSECPVCKGSGKVDAVVTIEWKANKTITFK